MEENGIGWFFFFFHFSFRFPCLCSTLQLQLHDYLFRMNIFVCAPSSPSCPSDLTLFGVSVLRKCETVRYRPLLPSPSPSSSSSGVTQSPLRRQERARGRERGKRNIYLNRCTRRMWLGNFKWMLMKISSRTRSYYPILYLWNCVRIQSIRSNRWMDAFFGAKLRFYLLFIGKINKKHATLSSIWFSA